MATIVPAAAGVGYLVWRNEPLPAVGVGTTGILLHWALSRGRAQDEELADSSYFFSFILTLVFLVVGLYSLGATGSGAPAQGAGGQDALRGTRVVLHFLQDLAAGLSLTVVGLLVRQVRTLASSRVAPAAAAAAAVQPTVPQELIAAMQSLERALLARAPESATGGQLTEARLAGAALTDSVEKASQRTMQMISALQEQVSSASSVMREAMQTLQQRTEETTVEMVRAGSTLGSAVSETTQRMEREVAAVLGMLQKQRQAAEEALGAAQGMVGDLRAKARTSLDEHEREWHTTLEQARARLTSAHEMLEGEYQRGLRAFAESGKAFAALAERAASDVAAMPNPAERLTGLWESVRGLEASLTGAVRGSAEQLVGLQHQVATLSDSLTALSGSARSAAGSVERGGAVLGGSLRKELEQMNAIIEEYVRLLEKSAPTLVQ
jgi:hypothetical protein